MSNLYQLLTDYNAAKATKEPLTGTVVGIDGTRVDVRVPGHSMIMRNLRVIGDVTKITNGEKITLKWDNGVPSVDFTVTKPACPTVSSGLTYVSGSTGASGYNGIDGINGIDGLNGADGVSLLDTQFWAAIGQPTDVIGQINTMVTIGTQVFVGGVFSQIGGIDANNIAVFDIPTNKWSALGDGLAVPNGGTYFPYNRGISSICEYQGLVYAGEFGYLSCWDGTAWSRVASVQTIRYHVGGIYTGGVWVIEGTTTYAAGLITCMASDAANLYIGGAFTHINSTSEAAGSGDGLYQFDGAYFSAYTPYLDMHVAENYGIALLAGDVFVLRKTLVEEFTNTEVVNIHEGVLTSVLSLDSRRATALISSGSYLYIGGSFPGGVIKWDGFTPVLYSSTYGEGSYVNFMRDISTGVMADPSVAEILELAIAYPNTGECLSLAADTTGVYVGGSFTTNGYNIVKYVDGNWIPLDTGLNAACNTITLYEGNVYVGGPFTTAGTKEVVNVAAFFPNLYAILNYLLNYGKQFADLNNPVVQWGDIEGNILLQVDLMTLLDGKVGLNGDETIAGIKTFVDFPITPEAAPTSDYQVANKKYVDEHAGSGGSFNLASLDLTSQIVSGGETHFDLTFVTSVVTVYINGVLQKPEDITLDEGGLGFTLSFGATLGDNLIAIVGTPAASSVTTDATLTGDGTPGNPLGVVSTGGGSVTTDATLSGDGTPGNPLSVVPVTIDNSLLGVGTSLDPLRINLDWFDFSITTDATLTGSGTVADPLSVVASAVSIATDATLTGSGTVEDPLSVVSNETHPATKLYMAINFR